MLRGQGCSGSSEVKTVFDKPSELGAGSRVLGTWRYLGPRQDGKGEHTDLGAAGGGQDTRTWGAEREEGKAGCNLSERAQRRQCASEPIRMRF